MDEENKKFIGRCFRYAAEILIVVAAFFGVTSLVASCGSQTKVTVSQSKPNSTVNITVSTNNPSEISVNPSDNLKLQTNE